MYVSRKAFALVLAALLAIAATIGGYYSLPSYAEDSSAQAEGLAGDTPDEARPTVPGDVIEGLVVDERGEPQTSAEDRSPAFPSVRIRVIDAKTRVPVKSLTVIPADYEEGQKHVTWQSQYLKRYAGEPAESRIKLGWDQTLLRIEADGYVPLVTPPIRRVGGETSLEVALERDPGLDGTVRSPNGKPAGGASVALCTRTNEVIVQGGRLRYMRHSRTLGKLATSAADGSFRLPSEVDPWVLVIAHDAGYAEVTAAEFARSSAVQLKPWGRIEGEFAPGGKPAAGQAISARAGRGDVDVILLYAEEATTEASGRFVFERVPPVKLYVQPWFAHGGSMWGLFWFSGRTAIAPGQTTRIALPRPGRPIVGRVSLAQGSGVDLASVVVEMSVSLRPPSMSALWFDEEGKQFAAYGAFLKSDIGQAFQRDKIAVRADGTFRIEGLPETSYLLTITAYRKPASAGADRGTVVSQRAIRVEVPALADSAQAVDLGNLVFSVDGKPSPPQTAPARER